MSQLGNSQSEVEQRPRTHKPRGVCRYYTTDRGCFAGDNCKFLHGEEQGRDGAKDSGGTGSKAPLLTPYDRSKICRYYANGFCRRGETCWFKHIRDRATLSDKGKERELLDQEDLGPLQCSICFEAPVTFGLLVGCNHIFCIGCIKKWRDPSAKTVDLVTSGNTKKCPMCRAPSHFITPSSVFVQHGTEEKERVVQNYKDSMARVPCKYFQQTKSHDRPVCPFGRDCFYKHENDDGTPYVFEEGADAWITRYAARNARRHATLLGYDDSDSEDGFFPFSFPFRGGAPGGVHWAMNIFNPDYVAFHDGDGGAIGNRPPPDVEVTVAQLDVPGNPTASAFQGRRGTNTNRGTTNYVAGQELAGTVRRLDSVGRTLNAMSNALQNAPLVELVESLRRVRDIAATAEEGLGVRTRATRRRRNRGLETAQRQQNDDMERLEVLAEQMLTSVNYLRSGPATPLGQPPEQLPNPVRIGDEPVPDRPPPLVPTDDEESDDNDPYGNMPDLQSVSNSSEDDDYSDYTDNEDNDDFSAEGNIASDALRQMLGRELGTGNTEEPAGRMGQAWPLLGFLGRSMSSSTPGHEGIDVGDNRPDLEAIHLGPEPRASSQVETHVPWNRDALVRPVVSSPADGTNSLVDLPLPAVAIVEPPFVTDGRGRVVWTSNSRNGQSSSASVPTVQRTSPAVQQTPPAQQGPAASPSSPPSSIRPDVVPTPLNEAFHSPTATNPGSQRPKLRPAIMMETIPGPGAGGSGFTTDGRGRVIGTAGPIHQVPTEIAASDNAPISPSTVQEPTPVIDSPRGTVLGRMLGAFMGSLRGSGGEATTDQPSTGRNARQEV